MVEDSSDRQASPAQVGILGGLVVLGLSPWLASGCGASGGIDRVTAREGIVSTLTLADNDKSIEIQVGDSVVVRLPENPATGFAWTIEKTGGDVLPLETSDYSPVAGAGVGGGGQRSLTFRAARAGTVKLALKLWREWEGDKSIAARFTANIRVRRGTSSRRALQL